MRTKSTFERLKPCSQHERFSPDHSSSTTRSQTSSQKHPSMGCGPSNPSAVAETPGKHPRPEAKQIELANGPTIEIEPETKRTPITVQPTENNDMQPEPMGPILEDVTKQSIPVNEDLTKEPVETVEAHLTTDLQSDVTKLETPAPISLSNSTDELMLDFDTFLLFSEVQAVLADKSVERPLLLELFNIVDKDMDGFVNDLERKDLLELIDLSFGNKSKSNSMKMEGPIMVDPNADRKSTSGILEDVESSSSTAIDSPPPDLCEESDQQASLVDQSAPTETVTVVSTPVSSNESLPEPVQRTRSKPKVIRFISPTTTEPPATPTDNSNRLSSKSTSSFATVETSGSTEASSPKGSCDEDLRDLPPQKKGFMVTKRESLDRTEVLSQPQSRFFVLEHGVLSYMDSTSKKPPFSITHREILLNGATVEVHRKTIHITPNTGGGSDCIIRNSGSQKDQSGEVTVLELKTEEECLDWLTAIREHMQFSTGSSAE